MFFLTSRLIGTTNCFILALVMITLISPDGSISQTTLEEVLSRGVYTLLYFYPKNDTPGCTLESQDFSQLIQDFAHYHINIVGVSKDETNSHCDFIAKYSLKPSYISDKDLVLHKQFSARGEKNNYGKIVQGVIRSTFLISQDGSIIKERRNVKATGHAQRVLQWIQKNL